MDQTFPLLDFVCRISVAREAESDNRRLQDILSLSLSFLISVA